MPFHTLEHIIDSAKGWKRPVRSCKRYYNTKEDVERRIFSLIREYGDENIIHMPMKGELCTEMVYVRIR